jgi:hypothetical protein
MPAMIAIDARDMRDMARNFEQFIRDVAVFAQRVRG